MSFKDRKRDDHGHVIGNDEVEGQECQHGAGGSKSQDKLTPRQEERFDKKSELIKKYSDMGYSNDLAILHAEKDMVENFDDDYEEEFNESQEEYENRIKPEAEKFKKQLDEAGYQLKENEYGVEKKPKFDIDELNRKTMRSAEMSQKVENAKRNGQTPQQVLDSVAYDMDISPDSEEYKNLKDIVMRDTRLNKESGAYEYNKYNIGSNKLLSGDERKKMEALAEEFKKAGLDVELKDTYEDYGADMKITNLISGDTQVLDPKEWMDYMNGNKSAEETVKAVKEGEYSDVFDWREPQQAEENYQSKYKDKHPDKYEKIKKMNPNLSDKEVDEVMEEIAQLFGGKL